MERDYTQSATNAFPVHVLPERLQRIIRESHDSNGFPVDYTAASMMAAISVAVGNSHRVEVKRNWHESAILYIAIVGRPGACKSHPLAFAMRPLVNADWKNNLDYQKKYCEYQQAIAMSRKERVHAGFEQFPKEPKRLRYLVSDVTQEGLSAIHSHNPRGLCLWVDELSCDSIRGSETYGFSYDKEWLARYGDVFLSEDLQNYTGIQYTRPERDIFACFSDALPDRWGRTLLNRREQIAASDEKRALRRLTSFDYLMGIDDASRMGGFRFAEKPGGKFINCEESLQVPPLANVIELMRAAHEIEISEEKHLLPSKKWLAQLLHPGTSLGGARPKASVIDEDGSLTVAKFPSRKDDYDVAQWEHFCHVMGRKAGLNVAETRTIVGEDYHILLSKRFDRNSDSRRIHFASALTMLGLTDGDNASTGYGYTDIVDFIVQHGSNVEQNLEELFRRVAFYIIIGNSDDHFRNHGFLLTRKGWELSPAYDINPTLSDNQSLLINRSTSESDLNILLASAGEYMLSADKAKNTINEVKSAMKSWRTEARRLGLPQRDIDMFAPRFDKWIE